MSIFTLRAAIQVAEALKEYMDELPLDGIWIGEFGSDDRVGIHVAAAVGDWSARVALVNQLADLLDIDPLHRSQTSQDIGAVFDLQWCKAEDETYVIYAVRPLDCFTTQGETPQ